MSTWVIPSDTPHFVKGGPEGAAVLDIFVPAREEWKQLEPLAPVRPDWP